MKIKIALHWQMAIALILGSLSGWLLKDSISIWGVYINGIGQLFMHALNMVVLPLVFLSCFLSFSSMLEVKSMGKIAAKTFAYFLGTALIATVLGIVIPEICKAGGRAPEISSALSTLQMKEEQLNTARQLESQTWVDYLVDIVPQNVFEAFASGQMLPVVFFALILGLFTTRISSLRQQTVNEIFNSFNEIIVSIATFIIRFAPLGIFAIVMMTIGQNADNIKGQIINLLVFVGFVWVTLLMMFGIILPLLVFAIAHVSPLKHFKQISKSLFVAFSTCSSYGALPLLLSETKDNCGVSNSVAGFTIPLGITFNKIGTIIYECVAVIFVAQAFDVPLSAVQQVSLVGMVIITTLGAPAMPMAGALVLAVLLKAMNLPDLYLQLFLAVDILCDMPKTLLNAYSTCCGAVIVASSEGEKLKI